MIAVRSADGSVTMVPGGATRLSEGDILTIVGKDGDMSKFQASK